MDATRTLDKEINSYLPHLNIHQKEVILSVIKTFADKEDEWWDNVELAAQPSIKRAQKEEREGKLIPNEEIMRNVSNG